MFFEIVFLLLSVPVGILISKLARDELKQGEKWFKLLIISSVLIGAWFYLTGLYYISWTMGFILIVTMISLIKSN